MPMHTQRCAPCPGTFTASPVYTLPIPLRVAAAPIRSFVAAMNSVNNNEI